MLITEFFNNNASLLKYFKAYCPSSVSALTAKVMPQMLFTQLNLY